ncbi:MAG TPA: MobF family relaxase [Terriglobia bacterium]
MIDLSKPLTAGQAHSYHQQEFANSEQRYYSQGNTLAGEWFGRLATEWGLAGSVRDEEFHQLAEGQHPVTGQQLVRHRIATEYRDELGKTVSTAEHRAGWDATFKAPKSVSITALVGEDDRVRQAHRESVQAALTELERYVQARIGGNHPPKTTGKMVAATFEHDSARPVNGYSAPHLHTHAVIFNVTETPDGKTHALQPHELYRAQSFATAVYRSELAARLRSLGYELARKRKGEFEIKGYTAEYLQASSPRRRQIKEYLDSHGLAGAEAAEIAAHRTREAKRHLKPEEIKRLNLELASEHGDQPSHVVAQARARQHAENRIGADARPAEGTTEAAIAQAAVTFARDRNIEREAVVDERNIVKDALNRAQGHARLGQIRENLESRIRTGEFIPVADSKAIGRQLTTAQMRGFERENLAAVANGHDLDRPLVRLAPTGAEDELQNLSPAQRAAARFVLESYDRITGLQGVAGGGKTTTLTAIRQAAERDRYEVEGSAPTSRATQQLEEAGISATTLQHFLTRARADSSSPKHLYILDESSLASTKQVHEFFNRLGPADRVLLVGDVRQHQAVEAGKPFEQMQAAGMRTARLDEVIRQRDPELRNAVELLAENRVIEAVGRLAEHGRIYEIGDSQARLAAVTQSYLRQPDGTLIVAPDNDSRLEINRLIHQALRESGRLAGDDHTVEVLTNRQELTGADRQWAARYEVGNVVRYTRGSKEFGLRREYANVTGIDLTNNQITVQRADGSLVTYDPKRLQGVNVYRREERELAAGDRIQFTAPLRQHRIANRQPGVVEKIDSEGNLRVRLDTGRAVDLNINHHPHLDHGYAMTSHSSQGQTSDRVIVHVPGHEVENRQLVNRRFAYVALSRARYEAEIYTNDAADLARRLSRDTSKRAAIEITPAAPEQQKQPLEQSIA